MPVIPSKVDRLAAGSICEQLWQSAITQNAMAGYEKLETTRQIRAAQGRLQLRLRAKTAASAITKEDRGDIDSGIEEAAAAGLIRRAGFKRAVSIPIKRPWREKSAVIQKAIRQFDGSHGMKLSAFKMRRCWDEYRRFLESRV